MQQISERRKRQYKGSIIRLNRTPGIYPASSSSPPLSSSQSKKARHGDCSSRGNGHHNLDSSLYTTVNNEEQQRKTDAVYTPDDAHEQKEEEEEDSGKEGEESVDAEAKCDHVRRSLQQQDDSDDDLQNTSEQESGDDEEVDRGSAKMAHDEQNAYGKEGDSVDGTPCRLVHSSDAEMSTKEKQVEEDDDEYAEGVYGLEQRRVKKRRKNATKMSFSGDWENAGGRILHEVDKETSKKRIKSKGSSTLSDILQKASVGVKMLEKEHSAAQKRVGLQEEKNAKLKSKLKTQGEMKRKLKEKIKAYKKFGSIRDELKKRVDKRAKINTKKMELQERSLRLEEKKANRVCYFVILLSLSLSLSTR